MAKIVTPQKPVIGQIIHGVHINDAIPPRVGNAVSIVTNGRRSGVGSVIVDHSQNPKYQVNIHGHGPTNTAKNVVDIQVKHVFDD